MPLPFLPVEAAKKPKKVAEEQVVSLKTSRRPLPEAAIMGPGPGDRGAGGTTTCCYGLFLLQLLPEEVSSMILEAFMTHPAKADVA